MAKLYVKTIKACTLLCILSFLSSVIITVFSCEDSRIIGLASNYSIGIACSSLLVIIPVSLQYKHEMRHLKTKFDTNIRSLIFQMYISLNDNPNDGWIEHSFKNIDELFHTFNDLHQQICYFSNRTNKRFWEEIKPILKAEIKFEGSKFDREKEKLFLSDAGLFIETAECVKKIIDDTWSINSIQSDIDGAKKQFHLDESIHNVERP